MSRTRGSTALAAVWLLLGFAAVGAGCAGSDDDDGAEQTATESWADDLCSSIGAWTDTIDDARTTLDDARELSVADIEDTVDTVRSSTTALADDLTDLGAPDTEAGDEAAQVLASLSQTLDEQTAVVEAAAATQPDSLQQRLSLVSTVSSAAAAMLSETTAAVTDIRELDGADEIRDAFESTAACTGLGD